MNHFAEIAEVLEELRAGRFVVVVDDEDRENEGDLVMVAEKMTPEAMAFLIRHTGGVVCLSMTNHRADLLELPTMVIKNESVRETGFTVSIEAADGVGTGISAADRCRTVLVAVDPKSKASDLVRPGHVFPLRAKDGGVLVRSGHTEASVDLCSLAGLEPVGVLSELMDDQGHLVRGSRLFDFARKYELLVCSVAQIIAYRLEKGLTGSQIVHKSIKSEQKMVVLAAESKLETKYGVFNMKVYRDLVNGGEHVVLIADTTRNHSASTLPTGRRSHADRHSEVLSPKPVLVRVHSECLTGEVFGSTYCDCGQQLDLALEMIAREGGVLLYLRQEGRGIGLSNKVKAYKLQESGLDTVEANRKLGFRPDLREYGIGAQILRDVGVKKMRMLTNNPRKIVGLKGYGLEVVEQVPLVASLSSERGRRYLKTKAEKLGHVMEEVRKRDERRERRDERGGENHKS